MDEQMELDAKEGHEDVTIVESPPSEVPDPSTEDSASKTEVPTTPGSTPSSHTPTSSSTSKKLSFKECIKLCASATTNFFKCQDHIQQVHFSKDGKKLYFVAAVENGPMGLYSVQTDRGKADQDTYLSGYETWTLHCQPTVGHLPPSYTQQFSNERRRKAFLGFLSYEEAEVKVKNFNFESKKVLWAFEPFLIKLQTIHEQSSLSTKYPPFPIPRTLDFVDHKVCPYDGNIMAGVCRDELFLLELGSLPEGSQPLGGHRLTRVTENQQTHVTAGLPSFCTMEEFDRFTGFWWQPKEAFDGRIYKILFEESDETEVSSQVTFNPSGQMLVRYKYPDAGTSNSKSSLKVVEFWFEKRSQESNESEIGRSVRCLPYELRDLMPDYEYLVRCDWMPDGKSVWLQLLNRRQTELRLIVLPLSAFYVSDIQGGETSVDCPPSEAPMGYLLLQEKSDDWINVTDSFALISADSSKVKFIWSSERSGFSHLELIEATLTFPPATMFNRYLYQASVARRPLTKGPWVVMPTEIWVDKERKYVYFHGNKDTPLEQHLYAVSYAEDANCPKENPIRLTEADFNHSVTMNEDCTLFYDTNSNFVKATQHSIFAICHEDGQPRADLQRHITERKEIDCEMPKHKLFTFKASTGEDLYGLFYPPLNAVSGQKYPTIVYVYGGPRFQVVKNSFSFILRFVLQWTKAGFSVVVIDNRGGYYRGKEFELHVKEKMGVVEVEDQVAGLQYIAMETGLIDLDRVGITGWSYGGYLSLMCLARRPDVYKAAVPGAAVTLWQHYDTAYTERYLGLVEGEAAPYYESSVIKHVDQLPDEPNRLLIFHGTDDDNVYLRHSTLLINALVKQGKPYQLQLFTGERHGVRSSTNTRHMDGTVLSFFVENL